MSWFTGSLTLLACFAPPPAARGQTIPSLHGSSFSGAPVDLPAALRGKVGILVIGFSEAARQPVTVWGTRLIAGYDGTPGVLFYEMPVLASVPKLLRGFVTGRIKASVAEKAKPHFVIVTEDEAAWRRLARYAAPDDAYVLVVDGQGVVRWQTQGAPTDALYAQMQQHVKALRAQPTKAAR